MRSYPFSRARDARALPRRGYSLPEVVVSLAILGLVFASITRSLDYATRLSSGNRMQADANMLLASESEYLRSLQWSQVEALAGTSTFHDDDAGDAYATQRSAQDLSTGLRSIVLTVSWSDPFGKSRSARTLVVISAGGLST